MLLLVSRQVASAYIISVQGPRRGRGWGGLQPPHFFGNFKELLRKRCFQPPHFESLFSPPPPHFQSSSAGPAVVRKMRERFQLNVAMQSMHLSKFFHNISPDLSDDNSFAPLVNCDTDSDSDIGSPLHASSPTPKSPRPGNHSRTPLRRNLSLNCDGQKSSAKKKAEFHAVIELR